MTDVDKAKKKLNRQFRYYRKRLQDAGVYAGTKHKRITINKDRLPEESLEQLGFTPVTVAIPEAGQDQLTSYRHPTNNYHIHSHHDKWTMHEDEHPAATMIMKSRPTIVGKVKAFAEGIPHAVTEGIPGGAIYLKNQAKKLIPGNEVPDMLGAIRRDRDEAKRTKAAYDSGILAALELYKVSADTMRKHACEDDGADGKKCRGCKKCVLAFTQ